MKCYHVKNAVGIGAFQNFNFATYNENLYSSQLLITLS